MYLKSQCALNHGNRVQSQPHGSEPLSPQNEKRKEKIQKPHEKRKRGKERNPASQKEITQESHVHPRKPLSPNQTEQKTQKTKRPKDQEPPNQRTKASKASPSRPTTIP